MTKAVQIAGETLEFHPWGAAYWKGRKMLLISDLHLGKVMHFRKFGAAVPRTALLENFLRLEKLETAYQPETICFLGDLFHSHKNREWELFQGWAGASGAQLVLVEGNHDILSHHLYEDLGIRLFGTWQVGPFSMTHHPTDIETSFNIAGHIHPAVRLGGKGRQRLRLPCFFLRPHQLILPAFGAFTGMHAISPGPEDRCFALAGEEVVALEQRKISGTS